jgi:alkylated DNA repair protein (DNA oxidative demethylase)
MDQQDDMFSIPADAWPPGLCVMRGVTALTEWLPAIDELAAHAPWRRWQVPGGGVMSVESTNAGTVGWSSDLKGYRYADCDPLTGRPWPPIPAALLELAAECASQAGYADFIPDSCLVNRYWPGARMGTHRDADELDFTQPIVSVSLGLPATFVWYGAQRSGPALPLAVEDGDVVVFGGPSRRGYHQVRTVRKGCGQVPYRINLTFRKAR